MHYGFGWFGGFGMILFWIVLVATIIILIKTFSNSSQKGDYRSKTSLNILKERYASGEITRDEFEKMKYDLSER